jgi:hypothetical protein
LTLAAEPPQITIIGGRFGCGKTEVALNYAVRLADRGVAPLLIDLDIVTPYFRTRDKTEEMARLGVEAITPFEAGQYLDMPAIDPRILGAIEQSIHPVVIDLGGDRQGARAVAQYARIIDRLGYAMYFVVNPYRPTMDTIKGIKAAIHEIETSSRLHVSALVSNPNLMSESTPELFLKGHCLTREASRHLGLPIAFAVASKSLFARLSSSGQERGQPPFLELGVRDVPSPSVDDQVCPVLPIRRFLPMFDSLSL